MKDRISNVYAHSDPLKIFISTLVLFSVALETFLVSVFGHSQITRMLPLGMVIVISVLAKDLDIARLTIFLTFTNGLIRRVLSGNDSHYIENDILIMLPLIPPLVYVFRRLGKIKSIPPIWIFLLTSIVITSIPRIPVSGISVLWGIFNTPIIILSVLLGLWQYHAECRKLVRNLANFGLCYLLLQSIYLPWYDYKWCIDRKPEFVQLMSCDFPDTRLWGTMESPAAMGCFFATALALSCWDLVCGDKSRMTKILSFLYFIALIVTGTRTFIVAIPLALLISLLGFKVLTFSKSLKYLAVGASILYTMPIIAQGLGLSGFWVSRLFIGNASEDVSANARIQQTLDWVSNISPIRYLLGNGIGSYSRGSSAIDSGFFAIIFEIGLPLSFLFYYLLKNSLVNLEAVKARENYNLCLVSMFLIANFSFPFITGSTSVLFWYLLSINYSRRISVSLKK
jgi:hypothetical protein